MACNLHTVTDGIAAMRFLFDTTENLRGPTWYCLTSIFRCSLATKCSRAYERNRRLALSR